MVKNMYTLILSKKLIFPNILSRPVAIIFILLLIPHKN